ncbi:hypothetical protein AB0I84_43765 [Streptomyces spectabilis]|uniref:Membrane associated rhomboid family serine protease n=1 Tax=Streptomyces spectabilis TaxID=68270 RepID=A0A7W8AQE0_STRST|nr:hypothetical protein [Streptomyces spectabilis]MBB5102631.1 membrane associated rhomboid family serine protease [Streptomyces spectabilis]MCI3907669.1 hypothetical protein [Streptomyces spectabilis]GGV30698.1 hypothetical protein GCM10010245_49670 [Streptomyces spectabilis]
MSSSSAPTPPNQPERGPFLTVHTALVLLTAVVVGLVMGGLVFVGGGTAAEAALVGLTAGGAGVPVLRGLIG